MAVEDDDVERSISSAFHASMDSKQSNDPLSAEDMAWIDSCLIKDPEILESSWDSLKDALLGVLDSQPDFINYSSMESDDSLIEDDNQILTPSNISVYKRTESPGRTVEDLISMDKEETDDESTPFGDSPSLHCSLRNAFQPNFQEFPEERTTDDSGLNVEAHETELSSAEIFKVWDLDVPDEEDDFAKELNKAISGSSIQPSPSQLESSIAQKDSKDDILENLVAGIADLSLEQDSPL
ncbi:uncharacterized protein LOC115741981 isoform X2 [Rhodamnia argentea]|nr:uncharacterized protein LOC115741981 isoform X2 [Rhodamnia argentea]XP_048134958.1 uncharacterized protein LOC115741981 isoform X2 [Rhodamnia argentea]XP_048134959.1 uncharacterized protein LOC115741981 isoform X2 [Rhodamnia argentea]